MGNSQSNNSLPVEQETADSNYRSSLIAQESDVSDEELENGQHAEMQPEKRQRIMYEQSIVVHGEEQGSSSNSQLTSQLVTLYNNSDVHSRIVILSEKLNHLVARRDDVVTELENAEIQPGKKRRKVVQLWLNEVQRKEHKIHTMIEDGQESTSNSNLSLYIESFIKEVDVLIQGGKFPDGLVLLDQESTRLPLSVDIKPVGTSFQQNTEIILGWLQNHDRCIIGVYGMGGVGKTTLLTHIHDQLLQDSNLSHKIGDVYWATVSQNCRVRKLQDDIAKALRLASFQEDDERKRAAVLHNRLAARGQTVLILDDMWEQVSREKVGIPFENGNCKIILSTRSFDVCRKMGCKDLVIKAETLNEGEAWDLFVEKLGHYDTLEEEAKKIAREIAKECGGLPLAIATMARSMTGILDINDWSTALNDLESARDQDDMKEDVFRILQYSYDHLNDKRVQNCFLSCILYEEDARIKRTTLIDIWIDEGLLDDIKRRDAQVSKGHSILNNLESSCLLESVLGIDEEKCVKMHDLIRDMGISITKEHPLFIAEARKQLKEVPEEEKWSKDLVKVSLSGNRIEEIPSGMAPMTPNLTVLMLNLNLLREIPDSFFVHMKALTILDLSETSIERVPESVSDLENLRSLILAHCEELIYVPSVAKLTKLRTLDLEWCYKLKEAPRGFERLKSVEKVRYIPWDVSDLIGFNKLIQILNSLSLYNILIWGLPMSEPHADWVGFFDRKGKIVKIEGGDIGEDKGNCLLPTTLECLEINECDLKGRSLDVVFPSLSEATGLKELIIWMCKGLESISGSSWGQYGSSFVYTSQLEWLKLEGLPDLISIAKLEAPHSFSHLRELFIINCPKMKVLLLVTCKMELHLPKLERIHVTECKEVEEIFGSNRATLSIPRIILPKLKLLEFYRVPKIKVIFPFTEELHLPKLKIIDVSGKKMKYPELGTFMPGTCEVEEMFESNKATLVNRRLILSNLEHLRLCSLSKIKVIFPFGEEIRLPSLQTIEVSNCKEVEEIFESSEATLCNPVRALLPNLYSLKLEDLPNLRSIGKGVLLDVPKLDKMLKALQDRDNRGLCRYYPAVRNCPMLMLSLFPGGLVGDQPDDDITVWGAFLSSSSPAVSFPFHLLEH